VHRLGAVFATLGVAMLGATLAARRESRWNGIAIMAALASQVGIGIAIVVFGVPLWAAVAHNGVAALLLLSIVNAHRRIWQD
jgi:cytochrome c oxidase assembly protein subunit 15